MFLYLHIIIERVKLTRVDYIVVGIKISLRVRTEWDAGGQQICNKIHFDGSNFY